MNNQNNKFAFSYKSFIGLGMSETERLLKEQNPLWIIGVYVFYKYKQNNDKLTNNYISKQLKISPKKVAEIKKQLLTLGILK